MSISQEHIDRVAKSLITAAQDLHNGYDANEFDDISELVETAIEEVKSTLKVEFRGDE